METLSCSKTGTWIIFHKPQVRIFQQNHVCMWVPANRRAAACSPQARSRLTQLRAYRKIFLVPPTLLEYSVLYINDDHWSQSWSRRPSTWSWFSIRVEGLEAAPLEGRVVQSGHVFRVGQLLAEQLLAELVTTSWLGSVEWLVVEVLLCWNSSSDGGLREHNGVSRRLATNTQNFFCVCLCWERTARIFFLQSIDPLINGLMSYLIIHSFFNSWINELMNLSIIHPFINLFINELMN